MSKKTINVLWTGGWDSTFRIIQLAMGKTRGGIIDYTIHPIYISGDGRPSEKREIAAMQNIRRELNNRGVFYIDELEIINKQDIPANQEITKSYQNIRREIRIGTQYDWLARYAAICPGVELGAILPDGEFSGVRETINKYGGLVPDGDSYVLDKKAATIDCLNVFGNFSYPLVFTKETEMVEYIKEWNCEEIISMIWFCHDPIGNEPCGFCRPCEQKMEGNMAFLLPESAQKRYKTWKLLRKLIGIRGDKIANFIYRRHK